MIIKENNSENFIYRNKTYRYGELTLHFLNYKKTNIKHNIQDINFKDDFEAKYSGNKFDKVELFIEVYTNLIAKFGEDKQKYVLKNEKFAKLLNKPYYVYMHHNIAEHNTQVEFKRFQDFLIFDFYNFCCNKTAVGMCPNCGNLFIKKTWGERIYCSETCRMKYSNTMSQNKIAQNPIEKEYYRIRKNYYMRVDRNPEKYSEKIFCDWNSKALKLKKECKTDENKYYELEELLKNDPFIKK